MPNTLNAMYSEACSTQDRIKVHFDWVTAKARTTIVKKELYYMFVHAVHGIYFSSSFAYTFGIPCSLGIFLFIGPRISFSQLARKNRKQTSKVCFNERFHIITDRARARSVALKCIFFAKRNWGRDRARSLIKFVWYKNCSLFPRYILAYGNPKK